MATAVQKKEGVGLWSETFPSQQTTFKESLMFMKRLLGVAVCNIAYLRMMFPSDAFVDKSLEGIHLKILKGSVDNPQVVHLIKCLKGVFDALDKKYLKMLVFMIHPDPNDPNKALDSYTFHFSYHDGDELSIYSNDKKLSTLNMANRTKDATLKMLRTLIVSASTLEPLPPVYSLSMKLFYYDDVTPPDYEPPGFEPTEEEEVTYKGVAKTITIGTVTTVYHILSLELKTGSDDESENLPQPQNTSIGGLIDEPIEDACPGLPQEAGNAPKESEVVGSQNVVILHKENPLAPHQEFSTTSKNFVSDGKAGKGKDSKRKFVENKVPEDDVCQEVTNMKIRGSKIRKQSRSKHLKFGNEQMISESQNSEGCFKAKSGKKSRKRLC